MNPIVTRCPNTGAMVFHTPQHILDQQKAVQELELMRQENETLKKFLLDLVAAQSSTVKGKLSKDLLELAAGQ